jgi:hypothetical protein
LRIERIAPAEIPFDGDRKDLIAAFIPIEARVGERAPAAEFGDIGKPDRTRKSSRMRTLDRAHDDREIAPSSILVLGVAIGSLSLTIY